jgi:MinD-like ATPase involved in chromosome partitioning or flagellar assembly
MTIASPGLRAYATVTGLTATFVTPDGRREPLTAAPDEDIRHVLVQRAADEARRAGNAVELITSGDRGEHRLLVATDGSIEPSPPQPAAPVFADAPSQRRSEGKHAPGRTSSPAPAPSQPTRASFIARPATEETEPSAWRELLARLGLTKESSPSEIARRHCERIVSRQWAGCRTLAVVNGKGGVGKTMTTAMLAAVYARYGGGNILAWDNNDTRGTLGWRTEQGLYDTTIRDLLAASPHLLESATPVSEIARFVHHQPDDRYDVLRSNPELLASHQRIVQTDFDLLMQVAARYYRMVVFDSGNDESAERWLRMVDSSHQLVLPTLAAPESAESAALLLDALQQRDARSAALAENAVVVVTQAEQTGTREMFRIADGFKGRVRAVETVPFDPALKAGPLRFDALKPVTRDAWLRVAATAASELEGVLP